MFKISTNYLDGHPSFTKTKKVEILNSKIDVHFFKEHFAKFYWLPEELQNRNLKNQEVAKWAIENAPKNKERNWVDTYKYDSVGRLIEYTYSGCMMCSQMPWGYKLIYNEKNDIIEQQIFYFEGIHSPDLDSLGIKIEFNFNMDRQIKLTYDERNIVRFENIGENGLEELIELVE